MAKNLLILLIASGSFSLALLMANSSQAAPILSQNPESSIFQASVLTNLSVNSPSLNWTQDKNNPILHSLGCSCVTCTQSSSSSVNIQ
ncbi:hypothetical protein PCC7424_3982 [Gloeothece citriformis PCC 7424]|uniref:Uncharacterized protein n=1 Tax=Gloeothece citriformis (strain PCC 7424) TaxID=65393 RepID=B7KKM3_GLOC7|nr:hypothetical protein [Gloeothece citriformis]ACK72356.1 hypothetical protein PCC7424_3982 [Gloeothece citriformis PCC 7424]